MRRVWWATTRTYDSRIRAAAKRGRGGMNDGSNMGGDNCWVKAKGVICLDPKGASRASRLGIFLLINYVHGIKQYMTSALFFSMWLFCIWF